MDKADFDYQAAQIIRGLDGINQHLARIESHTRSTRNIVTVLALVYFVVHASEIKSGFYEYLAVLKAYLGPFTQGK
jgi:hypothetical protein